MTETWGSEQSRDSKPQGNPHRPAYDSIPRIALGQSDAQIAGKESRPVLFSKAKLPFYLNPNCLVVERISFL